MMRHVPASCRPEARTDELESMATSLWSVGLSRGFRVWVKISLASLVPLCPCSARGARNNALDYAHVGDGIGKRCGNRRVVDDRPGECVCLQRVLIADFKADFFGGMEIRLGLKPGAAGLVRRGVEWDFNFDPA